MRLVVTVLAAAFCVIAGSSTTCEAGDTIFVSDSNGTDRSGCGSLASPCRTLRYAVNDIGGSVQPANAPFTVSVSAGTYGPSSCGALALRGLSVCGTGSANTLIDCNSTAPLLIANGSLVLSGLTVVRGRVDGVDALGVVAVDWVDGNTATEPFKLFADDLVFANTSIARNCDSCASALFLQSSVSSATSVSVSRLSALPSGKPFLVVGAESTARALYSPVACHTRAHADARSGPASAISISYTGNSTAAVASITVANSSFSGALGVVCS